MICPKCNGSGKRFWIDEVTFINCGVECEYCHGTGEIEPTNEEWFCNLTTEDKANRMTKFIMDIVCWNNDPKPSEVRNILKAWLKQPHREE